MCINVCVYINTCTHRHMSVCMYICRRSHYEVIFPTQLVYETNSRVLSLGKKSGDCGNLYVAAVYKWQVLQGQIPNICLYLLCNCASLGPQLLNPSIFTPVWWWKLLVIPFCQCSSRPGLSKHFRICLPTPELTDKHKLQGFWYRLLFLYFSFLVCLCKFGSITALNKKIHVFSLKIFKLV